MRTFISALIFFAAVTEKSYAATDAFPANCGLLPKQDFKGFVDALNAKRKTATKPEMQLTTELTKVSFHHINNLECSADYAEAPLCNPDDPNLGWKGDSHANSNNCNKVDEKGLGCCGATHVECTKKRMTDNTDGANKRTIATAYPGELLDQIIIWHDAAIVEGNKDAVKAKVTSYFQGAYGQKSPAITAASVHVGVSYHTNYLVIIVGSVVGSDGVCPEVTPRKRSLAIDATLRKRSLAIAPAPANCNNAGIGLEYDVISIITNERAKHKKAAAAKSKDLFHTAYYKVQNLVAVGVATGCQVPTSGRTTRKKNCENDQRSWKTGAACFPTGVTPAAACCHSNIITGDDPCWDGKFALFNTGSAGAVHGNFVVVAGTKIAEETPENLLDRVLLNKNNHQQLLASTDFTKIGGYISDTKYSFMLSKAAVTPATECEFTPETTTAEPTTTAESSTATKSSTAASSTAPATTTAEEEVVRTTTADGGKVGPSPQTSTSGSFRRSVLPGMIVAICLYVAA